MNLKFWPGKRRTAIQLFDPGWEEKKRMLLDRLANTPPGDPLMTGLLGMIDRLLLQQIQRCESPQIADGEARAIVNSIGLLVGFRTDIEEQWRKQLNRRAMEEAKQKAAERHR